MLKTGNMGMVELGWLSAVPYLAALMAEFFNAAWSDRDRQAPHRHAGRRWRWRRWPFMAPTLLGRTHFWVSFALLVVAGAAMYAPYGPFFAYIAETLPANVAGGAIALINSHGRAGRVRRRLWRGLSERRHRQSPACRSW